MFDGAQPPDLLERRQTEHARPPFSILRRIVEARFVPAGSSQGCRRR
jgi:hypothetical protein